MSPAIDITSPVNGQTGVPTTAAACKPRPVRMTSPMSPTEKMSPKGSHSPLEDWQGQRRRSSHIGIATPTEERNESENDSGGNGALWTFGALAIVILYGSGALSSFRVA